MNGSECTTAREGICACGAVFPGPKRGPIPALCPECKRQHRNGLGRGYYAGQRDERAAHPQPVDKTNWIQCPYCPDLMPSHHDRKQCGARECRLKYNAERGKIHTANYAARYPEKRRARRSLRRALEKGAQRGEMVFPVEIFERDGWLCQLCGGDVPLDAQFPDPLSATIDHVVPVIQRGPHTNDNVQLAHLHCNCSAGAKVDAA